MQISYVDDTLTYTQVFYFTILQAIRMRKRRASIHNNVTCMSVDIFYVNEFVWYNIITVLLYLHSL